MENCIFCKIIKGEIPSYTIYEDENIKVFLDINPNSNGHALIIPKKHIKDIQEIDSATFTQILDVIQNNIYKQLKNKLNCDGITIVQNNEYGQEVKHFHIHIIPRYKNDNVKLNYNKENIKPVEEIYSIIK
ncbi:MAG: HIT domain-containing protein [Bacilli bacterium]|nr:HIT domain-containing protein [Bacilli bacterium]